MGPRRLLALPVVLGFCFAAPALANPRVSAPLQKAFDAFNQGEDQSARAELQSLLAAGKLTSAEAARAHLYLGLISLNQLQNDEARGQFAQALSLDSTLELPLQASPKAELPFAQARLAAQAMASPPVRFTPTPSAPAPSPAPLVVQETESRRPSYALPLAVGGVGLAAVAVGFVFLGLSAGSLSQARQPITDASQWAHAESLASTSQTEQSAANWLLGCGAGAIVTAGALFLIENLSGGAL